jgi:hypothetical protein
MSVRFEPVLQFGTFSTALRNIRLILDEYRLRLDLIPSQLGEVVELSDDDPEYLKAIMGAGREIVEADTFLRLEFETIWAFAVHDEFAETGAFTYPCTDWPKLADGRALFPFVKVLESPWLAEVPDHQLPAEGAFHHFRIVSMTTYLDVIAPLPSGRWVSAD